MFPYLHITLPTYAVFIFIGGFAVLLLAYSRIDKFQLAFPDFLKCFLICAIGILIGSRLLFVLITIPRLKNITLLKILTLLCNGGFVFYGGLFGALAGIKICQMRWERNSFNQLYELAAPCFPLFHTFGRIGCFCAGCCYGLPLQNPIILTNGLQMNRVPVQLLEAGFNLVLVICLLLIELISKRHQKIFPIYLLSYAAFRFIVEFWRGDAVRGIWAGLSTSQWISLVIWGYFLIKMLKTHLHI